MRIDVHVCHAHSGETHYFSSTKPEKGCSVQQHCEQQVRTALSLPPIILCTAL